MNVAYHKESIGRLLELIDQVNQLQEMNRKIHPADSLLVTQYDRLRAEYLQELDQLMKTSGLKVTTADSAA